MQPRRADSHEVAHHCLCRHHSELIVALLLALQVHREQLLAPFDQLEALLFGELKARNLIVEHADVLVAVALELLVVLHDVDLMAKGDRPKELLQPRLGRRLWALQDSLCLGVLKLLGVLNLVRQVFKRQLLVDAVVLSHASQQVDVIDVDKVVGGHLIRI